MTGWDETHLAWACVACGGVAEACEYRRFARSPGVFLAWSRKQCDYGKTYRAMTVAIPDAFRYNWGGGVVVVRRIGAEFLRIAAYSSKTLSRGGFVQHGGGFNRLGCFNGFWFSPGDSNDERERRRRPVMSVEREGWRADRRRHRRFALRSVVYLFAAGLMFTGEQDKCESE